MARAVLLSLVLVVGAAAPASAAKFRRCLNGILIEAQCANVRVPLDHSGATPGSMNLFVARLGKTRRSGRALVYLSGGPGSSGIEELGYSVEPLFGLLHRYDVIGFDQRGTGDSGLLVCPAMQKDRRLRSTRPAEACAKRVGPRRRFFTTAAGVRDLEAVRRAVGARKLLLFGVSYGTKVALAYARAYPQRVERMILDSVVDPDEADPWGLENFAAMGPSLRRLCPARCRGVSQDPAADLGELNSRLAVEPMRGVAYDVAGRARSRALTGLAIADLLFDADYAPVLRAAVPSAMKAALVARDPAPLLRLMELARPLSDPQPARSFSAGRYAAVCEETPLPWERTASDPAERLRQALERASALPAGAFAPFDFETIRGDEIDLCLRWPLTAEAPLLPGREAPYPNVPVLLLQGQEDLRTPASVSARLAERFPRARRVLVPGVGHSVLGADPSGCAMRRLGAWMRGRRVLSRCPRVGTGLPAVAVPPSSFADLEPIRGLPGDLGRTVAAIDATLDDVMLTVALSAGYSDRGSGLRGGTFRLRDGEMTLRRLRVVPGVLVSGRSVGAVLRLSVAGSRASRGVVRLSPGGRLRGRLGGRRVSVRLPGGGPVALSARSRLVR